MIITVCQPKGGSSKSTTVQNLAVCLANDYDLNVMVVDADPKSDTLSWADDREEDREKDPTITQIKCIAELGKDIGDKVKALDKKHDVTIIDCLGGDNPIMRACAAASHLTIVPLRPNAKDTRSLPTTTMKLKEIGGVRGINVRFVITQTPYPRYVNHVPSSVKDIKEYVEALGYKSFDAFLSNRPVYDDADAENKAVIEMTDTDNSSVFKAHQEVKALTAEVLEAIATVK